MHPLQSQLYADHYNFLRLLTFLEAEIACYEANSLDMDNGRHARLAVVLDILDYIQTYPERWHHPLENAAFERLLIKQVPNSDQIWGLKSEHKKLEALTHKAMSLFASVANDVVVPVEELVKAAREFIQRQQEHISLENKLAYPLMTEYLSDTDWDDLGRQVSRKIDPLFGGEQNTGDAVATKTIDHSRLLDKDRALHSEYRNLYKMIMQAERGVATGVSARAKNYNQSARL